MGSSIEVMIEPGKFYKKNEIIFFAVTDKASIYRCKSAVNGPDFLEEWFDDQGLELLEITTSELYHLILEFQGLVAQGMEQEVRVHDWSGRFSSRSRLYAKAILLLDDRMQEIIEASYKIPD